MIHVDFISVRVGRLVPSFSLNNHLFPLFEFRGALLRKGVSIRFFTLSQLPLRRAKGSVLCLDSRCFRYTDGILCAQQLELLDRLRSEYERLLWFDNRDSTGTTQFEVLPFVDKYCKKQFLRDRRLYQEPFYGGRIFTNYIHNHYGINDHEPEKTGILLDVKYMDKLELSWNFAYSDFRSSTGLGRHINAFRRSRAPQFYRSVEKPIDIQARFTTSYDCKAVRFHRQSILQMLQKLEGLRNRTGKLARKDYQKELKQTRAVLSPFGWGEICYRDFEAMIYGCALIKPSVSHLETYPNMYHEGITYIALPWNIEAAITRLQQIFHDKSLLMSVAQAGQKEFQELWGEKGVQAFCGHFLALVDGH